MNRRPERDYFMPAPQEPAGSDRTRLLDILAAAVFCAMFFALARLYFVMLARAA